MRRTPDTQMELFIRNYSLGQYILSSPSASNQFNEPITKKWLHGDIISQTHEIQHRDIKKHKSIAGIIDFLNRVRIGMTSKGVPLYNFHPYDPGYPTMVVASKLKPATNMVAIASFEHWNDKHPRAGIQHIFGAVGDVDAETAVLRMGLSVTNRVPDNEEHYEPNHIHFHNTTPWDIVINIDPPGCQDVDDVIGWRQTPSKTEFFIGIVDIAAWVPEDSPLDNDAKQSAQTIYIDGEAVDPMFPAQLSTQNASLRADGLARPVVALTFCIENNKVVSTQWTLLNVVVTAAYTYESVLNDAKISQTLPHLLSIVTEKPATADPHIWIEQAMILYNTKVAEVLMKYQKGIMRRHAGTKNADYQLLAEKTGKRELAFLGAAAGEYIPATSADIYHAGLDLKMYCHATSPLRRYADVVNHRWLKHLVFGFQEPYTVTMTEHLNYRANQIKQFERLIWFLQHLNQDGSITSTQGIIISYNDEQKTAKVYVPEWKRTIRAVHTTTKVFEPGNEVTIRAFSNLKATSIYQRVVCTML